LDINATKIQGPATSIKFLGVKRSGACQNIPSKVKVKLLHPITSYQKEIQPLVAFCILDVTFEYATSNPSEESPGDQTK
jgi:hypothetical protein